MVAQLHQREIDGAERFDTWFVQCKHYERGVPPDKLEPAVNWATAERPSVLLFVVSNFLSNPAKSWLDDYERNNRPAFRIKYWERKDLERFLSSVPLLAKKYRLALQDPALSLHPAHVRYVLNPSLNTLDYLFTFLDTMEPKRRDEIFDFVYLYVINPHFRKSERDDQKLSDLMLESYSYADFRTKCLRLRRNLAEHFLVRAIVYTALQSTWSFADSNELDEVVGRHRWAIEYFTQELGRTEDEKLRADLEGVRATHQDWIRSAPEHQRTWEGHYKYICETVLPHLYLEEPVLIERAAKRLRGSK